MKALWNKLRERGDALKDEEGAVTVDFVVLTAALATLGLVVFSVIVQPGLHDAASDVYRELTRTWN